MTTIQTLLHCLHVENLVLLRSNATASASEPLTCTPTSQAEISFTSVRDGVGAMLELYSTTKLDALDGISGSAQVLMELDGSTMT